jgi:hypothetical protein
LLLLRNKLGRVADIGTHVHGEALKAVASIRQLRGVGELELGSGQTVRIPNQEMRATVG